ncbi:MAG: TlpA family protein disulfide reductase [Proteobacteria bacterium]|nr:TlpA family protein disulfide reductase [Pseudomonadota bacterium]
MPEAVEVAAPLPQAVEGQVVLVNFWASWCGPCMEELPRLDALNDELVAEDVSARVVTIALDAQTRRADAVVKKLDLDLAVAHDPKGELAALYGVDSMPASFLIGPDGKVVESVPGSVDDEALEALEARMRTLVP